MCWVWRRVWRPCLCLQRRMTSPGIIWGTTETLLFLPAGTLKRGILLFSWYFCRNRRVVADGLLYLKQVLILAPNFDSVVVGVFLWNCTVKTVKSYLHDGWKKFLALRVLFSPQNNMHGVTVIAKTWCHFLTVASSFTISVFIFSSHLLIMSEYS